MGPFTNHMTLNYSASPSQVLNQKFDPKWLRETYSYLTLSSRNNDPDVNKAITDTLAGA